MSVNTIGKAIERVEIIRSALRWSSQLDKVGIQKIMMQVNQLRNELFVLSRTGGHGKKSNCQGRFSSAGNNGFGKTSGPCWIMILLFTGIFW